MFLGQMSLINLFNFNESIKYETQTTGDDAFSSILLTKMHVYPSVLSDQEICRQLASTTFHMLYIACLGVS